MIFGSGATQSLAKNTTRYFPMWDGTGTALPYAFPSIKNVTFSKLKVSVTVNTLDDTATFTLMKNGNPTGLTVTFNAAEVAIKDSVVDVAVAENDTLTLKATNAALNGGLTFYWCTIAT